MRAEALNGGLKRGEEGPFCQNNILCYFVDCEICRLERMSLSHRRVKLSEKHKVRVACTMRHSEKHRFSFIRHKNEGQRERGAKSQLGLGESGKPWQCGGCVERNTFFFM